jgi:bla regulator protein blaR1
MTGEISNHLWQSTLFAIAVGLISVALRRNQARIRYWLWFSASVKFFVPFTLLITFGSHLEWAPTVQQITPPAVSSAMGQISQPFSDFSRMAEPTPPSTPGDAAQFTIAVLALVWMSGAMALALSRLRLWRRVRAVVRASTLRHVPGIPSGVDVRSAPGLMEPGVVGWWRPVLLVPQGIEDHLTPRQLDAIIAHELCHVRRRDNLTSTIHMVVEAIFWFHPLVWWIGARLIEERERACDEEVLRLHGDPRIYAEGILNVCRRYAGAPLVCVSGVSGANLRKRIEAIMMNRLGRRLNVATKAALAAAAVTVLTLPVVVGALSPAADRTVVVTASAEVQRVVSEATERFGVVTIRQNKGPAAGGPVGGGIGFRAGRFSAENITLQQLITYAYELQAFEIFGAPSWAASDRFDIAGTMEPSPTGLSDQGPRQRRLLRALLAERFELVVHEERRDMPVYSLVLARPDRRLGERLRPFEGECMETVPPEDLKAPWLSTPDPGKGPGRGPSPCMLFTGVGRLSSSGTMLSALSSTLARFPAVSRRVIDRTGLTGRFEYDLEWTPMVVPPGAAAPDRPSSDTGPTIFTALREQLGLRLESTKETITVLVIDSVNQPSPN